MRAGRAANLLLKFLLELGAIAALAYWGATVGSGALSVLAAIAAAAAAIGLWGIFAAPRSARRLPLVPRVLFECSVFAVATAALIAAGRTTAAVAFALLVVVNAALTTAFHQWEE